MKEVYVRKNLFGGFSAVSREDATKKLIEDGYPAVFIITGDESLGIEPVKITIIDLLIGCVTTKERLEDLANEYIDYVNSITGSTVAHIEL